MTRSTVPQRPARRGGRGGRRLSGLILAALLAAPAAGAVPTRSARSTAGAVPTADTVPTSSAAPAVEPAAPAAELLPVPHPALDLLDAPAAEQVRRHRAALDELLAESGAGSAARGELARSFGELAQLYLLYDLVEPAAAAFENARRLAPADVRPVYYLAVLAERDGRMAEAETLLREVLAAVPEDLAARLRLGEALFRQGRSGEAEEEFRRVLAAGGAPAAAHYGLGRVAAQRRDHAAAAEHFTAVLERQPWASAVHHPLGLAHRGLGDLERARRHLERNGREPVAFPDPLVDGLVALGRSPRLRVVRGNDARRKGFLAPAAEEYRAALALDPANATAHYNLGSVLAEQGDEEAAQAHFRAALAADPDHADARFNLATALARGGRLEEAAAELATLLAGRPDDLAARFERAAVLGALDRHGEAEAELRRALAVAGGPTELAAAHRRLASLALGAGDSVRALEHLGAALAADPASADAHAEHGRALGLSGRFTAAAASLERAVELAPERADLHLARAEALFLAGDCGGAIARLEASAATLPDDADVALALAHRLATCPRAEDRDGERAVELAQAAWRQRPGPRAAAVVAMALAEAGRREEAVRWQRDLVAQAEAAGAPAPAVAELRRDLATYRAGGGRREAPPEGGR